MQIKIDFVIIKLIEIEKKIDYPIQARLQWLDFLLYRRKNIFEETFGKQCLQ